MENEKGYVYILSNISRTKIYIGATKDLKKLLLEKNN